ncbi:MAG: sulfotransferase [Geminicoccaceae bacterium]
MLEAVKIVYVAGSGRSGSTVLGQVLGAVPNWTFCGELRQGFSLLAANQLCGCGTPAQECSFWRAVIEHAFGGFDRDMLERACALTERVSLHRHSLVHLSPLKTSSFMRDTAEYAEIVTRVYQGIRSVTGSDVIIDSSKIPSYYFILKESDHLETKIVHIVRDSRAVVYSNRRKKYDPSNTWGREYLLQQGLTLTAVAWNLKNAFISSAMAKRADSILLRYEDFMAAPSEAIRRVVDLVDPAQSPPPIRGGQLEIGTQHTLGGNPVKFRTGPVQLRLDDEWQSMMEQRHRILVTGLTWPMIAAYGYLGRGRRAGAATVAP